MRSAFNVSEDTFNRFKVRGFGASWKRAQRQTLNMISGLLINYLSCLDTYTARVSSYYCWLHVTAATCNIWDAAMTRSIMFKGVIDDLFKGKLTDTWITDEIKKYEAYKMHFKYSTGLIPLKKGRGEPQNRLTGKKKRTPRAVVIQEPLSVPVKKTKESSSKLKEVLDETKDKSEAEDNQDDWGSTNKEELLRAYKDEKPKEIMWYSTKEDESDNDAQDESHDEEEEEDEKASILKRLMNLIMMLKMNLMMRKKKKMKKHRY
ncbi:hypothetical protein Tco_1169049 [Tanacetum coccineum]